MRLGGFFVAEAIQHLEPLCEKMDTYNLSAIQAPNGLAGMPDDECAAFGEEARRLGMVVGEVGMWSNLMTTDKKAQAERIEATRTMLKKADIMGCHAIVTLVGTKREPGAPPALDAYMYTDECKAEFREIVLRILDGLDLKKTMHVIEPWHNAFFYQPEDIRQFIDSVDHPAFGLHLDQMNMVSQQTFYNTTDLINRTFDLLADKVASVHMKDVAYDHDYMFLKLDEVYIGDGVMDYETYLKRLAELPADTPCFCEHLMNEGDYALNFARVHRIAEKAGVRFLRRGE